MSRLTVGVILLFLHLFGNSTFALEKEVFTCGISEGYPPYQFKGHNKADGFDADVARLVFIKLNKKLVFRTMKWSDVMGHLKYSTELDFVSGMERLAYREHHFDFTSPYYTRKSVIFVLASNISIYSPKDLSRKRVAGDRHSYVEIMLREKGLHKSIRIQQTPSKEVSMKMLKKRVVVAVIAPEAVGIYLAERLNIQVRTIDVGDPGSPVCFAVKKGNHALLTALEKGLQQLKVEGAIDTLHNAWFKARE